MNNTAPEQINTATAVVDNKTSEKEQMNKKIFMYGIGGVILLVLVVIFSITLYRVYGSASKDVFTVGVARVLRLPVMKINGETILYSDYADDMKAISKMRDYDLKSGGPSAALTDSVMSDQVLLRLANNLLVAQSAAKYKLKVEQTDIDSIKAEIVKQFPSEADADKEIMTRYGWNLKTYINKVVVPYLLQQKLTDSLATDPTLRGEVLNRATLVLNRIKAGEDFATLAKEYGEDATSVKGGDLDWFGKQQMVPQFETAAFALKKGELSKELVETEYGYHIIKVVDKKTEKGAEQVRASHILFRFASFETLLSDMAKNATTHLYINVNDPFAQFKISLEAPTDASTTQK